MVLATVFLAFQHVAILKSGERIPCVENTQPGAVIVESTWGTFFHPLDPVAKVQSSAKEAELLSAVRETDFPRWLDRAQQRGLVAELIRTANQADNKDRGVPSEQLESILQALEGWGARIETLPKNTPLKDRRNLLWREITKETSPAKIALLLGQLKREIPGPGAPPDARLGLVDLRRGLRHSVPWVRRAAARIGSHQVELDLFRLIHKASLEEKHLPTLHSSATAAFELHPDQALGLWTHTLLSKGSRDQRIHAIHHLVDSKHPSAVEPLILALSTATRAPGRYFFSGSQVSLVTDFDVEVANGAAIAKPVVNVLTEGALLEVRILSTPVIRAAQAGLQKLTGEMPGPKPEDWLDWWRRGRMEDE